MFRKSQSQHALYAIFPIIAITANHKPCTTDGGQ